MAKSRLAILLVAAACTAWPAGAAPPASAEDAIARQSAGLHRSLGLDCRREAAEDDIVVCGRQGPDPNRLPLPQTPEPGDRLAGEAVTPDAALAATALPKCSTTGPDQHCSGGLPIIPMAIWLVQTAVKAPKGRE